MNMPQEHSAGGVVIHEGKVLLIYHRRGEWLMPKGHIEPGETTEEAAIREIKEETNLDAELITQVGENRYTFTVAGDPQTRLKIVTWFLARPARSVVGLEPLVPEGIISLDWLTREEARERLSYEADRRIMEQAFTIWEGPWLKLPEEEE